MGGGGGVRVGSGPSSQFNFCFRRCNHLSPRGYRCKDCDLEGGKWRQNLEEDVVASSGESDKKEDMERGSSNHVHVTEPRSCQPSCKIY